jgi:uncharacterized protein (TIGR02147 family)
LFSSTDFRPYVRWRLEKLPRMQRELKNVSARTGIHMSVLSQVLNHRRELSAEQAYALGRFLSLSDVELDYFCTLAALGRAEDEEYRGYLHARLAEFKSSSESAKPKPKAARKLEDWAKIEEQFFSVWYYSAIYLMTSISSLRDVESISTYLKLPRTVVREVLDRLVEAGLCERKPNGEYVMNPGVSIKAEGRLLRDRHRSNWRLRASQALFEGRNEDQFFTHAMTVSREDAARIRGWLDELRARIDRMVEKSQPEVGLCLNFDLFSI